MEQFSNNAQTTLSGGIDNVVTSLTVASASGFPTSGNFRIIIDGEILLVTAVSGTTFTVTRGAEGTAATSHGSGSSVTHVITAASLPQAVLDRLTGANGAGLVLLEQHSASSSAELDFTAWYSAAYDEYIIDAISLKPATSGVDLLWQCSTNGGSSYDTTSNYDWSKNISGTTTSFQAYTQSASDTAGRFVGFSSSTPSHFSLRLFDPGNATTFKGAQGYVTFSGSDGNWYFGHCLWRYKGTSPVNAFRLLYSSGNIASGTVRVYGVAKS